MDWTTWRKALGVQSAGGGYTVEYIIYVLFSVPIPPSSCLLKRMLTLRLGSFCRLRQFFGPNLRHFCEAQWDTRDQDRPWWLRDQIFHGSLDPCN